MSTHDAQHCSGGAEAHEAHMQMNDECPWGARRSTRCEVVRQHEAAEEQLSQMDSDAYRHEAYGWSLTFDTAPRCADRRCDICHG